MIAGLSEAEKKKLIDSLEPDKKYTQKEVQAYIDKIKELENREPEVREVEPEDYAEVKRKLKLLQGKVSTDTTEYIESVNKSALIFSAGVANFIERFGGYVWLTGETDFLNERERKGFLRAVNNLNGWVQQMIQNLERGDT